MDPLLLPVPRLWAIIRKYDDVALLILRVDVMEESLVIVHRFSRALVLISLVSKQMVLYVQLFV